MTAGAATSTGSVYKPLALIVDRDADTRQMYAEYLRPQCDVDEAEDGREALAEALTRHPNIVITETRLSGISGYDLCRLLRDDVLTKDIAVLFVTGDAYAQDVIRAQTVGADGVLVKPCLPDELARTIREVLQKSAGPRAVSAPPPPPGPAARPASRRVMLSRAHQRVVTTEPPLPPPTVVCPSCDEPLRFTRSHVGGVSERHKEQLDYFECPAGCGVFQYRQRTRKFRRVS